MTQSDSTESSSVYPIGNTVPNPAFPVPPGGHIPDLNLGVWPGSLQGASSQVMPDPGKPAPSEYQLVGDPYMGGYDPSNSAPPAQNLAGVDGWPPSASSLTPSDTLFPGVYTSPIAPQYTAPDTRVPTLQTANLANDGISFEPRKEFDPDPANPDLAAYSRPYGLTIHNSSLADLFKPDPVVGDLTNPDIPSGIQTVHDPLTPDPLVPDLQDPQLEQSVHMTDRPGDLAVGAINVMSSDPTAQSARSVPYPSSFMDASGLNTTRRRHMDLMTNGLRTEEQ